MGRSSLSLLCARVSKWSLYFTLISSAFGFFLPIPHQAVKWALRKVFYFGDERAQPSMLLLGSKQCSLLWWLTQLALSPKPHRNSAQQTYPVCRVAPNPITNFIIFLINSIFQGSVSPLFPPFPLFSHPCRVFMDSQGTLHIRAAVPEDAGNYSCSANNVLGQDERAISLEYIGTGTPGGGSQLCTGFFLSYSAGNCLCKLWAGLSPKEGGGGGALGSPRYPWGELRHKECCRDNPQPFLSPWHRASCHPGRDTGRQGAGGRRRDPGVLGLGGAPSPNRVAQR